MIQNFTVSAVQEIKLLKDVNEKGCFNSKLKRAMNNLHCL